MCKALENSIIIAGMVGHQQSWTLIKQSLKLLQDDGCWWGFLHISPANTRLSGIKGRHGGILWRTDEPASLPHAIYLQTRPDEQDRQFDWLWWPRRWGRRFKIQYQKRSLIERERIKSRQFIFHHVIPPQ